MVCYFYNCRLLLSIYFSNSFLRYQHLLARPSPVVSSSHIVVHTDPATQIEPRPPPQKPGEVGLGDVLPLESFVVTYFPKVRVFSLRFVNCSKLADSQQRPNCALCSCDVPGYRWEFLRRVLLAFLCVNSIKSPPQSPFWPLFFQDSPRQIGQWRTSYQLLTGHLLPELTPTGLRQTEPFMTSVSLLVVRRSKWVAMLRWLPVGHYISLTKYQDYF